MREYTKESGSKKVKADNSDFTKTCSDGVNTPVKGDFRETQNPNDKVAKLPQVGGVKED